MARIKVLPEDVSRRIAAGEVVERPSSVIKELLENSLDAGATEINIRTLGAGVDLIEVSDNGLGMSPADVPLAPRSFATSKIVAAGDLEHISTYGFRGEALASISAVSRFEVVSSDADGGEGWAFAIEGNEITRNEPAPHERGTTIKASELFFNTPARKKFLKSEMTERRRILETVLAFGLISPQVELHYSEDGRRILDLVPHESWRDRVGAILGVSTMKHMVDVSLELSGMKLSGFVSLPTFTRGNRNHQFLFINKRLVRERTMVRALQEAMRTVIPYKRFPVAVLSLEVPFEDVDVNVHPNKFEVRLRQERRVFDIMRRGIAGALSGRAESGLEVSYGGARSNVQALHPRGDSLSLGETDVSSADAYRTRVKQAYGSYMSGHATIKDMNPQLSLRSMPGQGEAEEPRVEELAEKIRNEEGLFWQFNNAYIFIQVRGGLVVIDQHAAHERIIFDTSRKRLENEIPVSQQILFPIHLELSLPELEIFRTCKDVFYKLGFHLEPFGGMSILVRGYPHGLKNWEEGRLLRSIFDDLLTSRFPGQSHADRIVASFACRSAVKAGQKLSIEEMKELADQLFAVENPYSCPHGRPTIRRLSLEEVEGWFNRR